VTLKAATFLPLTMDAARRLGARPLLDQAMRTDRAAAECWTALLAGCGGAARRELAPQLRRRIRPRHGQRGSVRAQPKPEGRRTPSVSEAASEELGYEQARDRLVEVVRELEAGGLSLEQSLALWEKGEKLAKLCERHLEGARERIEAALASVEDETGDGQ
jgi:exodeoxyribonuclease VII small subunit